MFVRPEIPTGGVALRDQAQAVLAAICERDSLEQPTVFRRLADLARIMVDGDQFAIVEQLTVDRMRVVAEDSADWIKVNSKGEESPDYCPIEVLKYLLALGTWPDLPLLRQMLRAPTVLPDGRVVDQPGYDPASGLYLALAPGLKVPPIPANPTEDQAQAALTELETFIGDFDFATPADHANALGLQLTPLVRPLFGAYAPVPLFGLDAPAAGSGKGLLVDVAALIASGKPAPIQPADGADAAEWRKRITAQLSSGADVLHLDNLSEPLDDGSLCAALTNPDVWADRILGTSIIARVAVTTTFAVSGNNLQIKGDMVRRVIPVRIDTHLERPDLRPLASFRYPGADKLRAAVAAGRGRLIAAGLTLARYWLVRGQTTTDVPRMGSFEAMTATIGGILASVGVEHWLGNLDRFRATQSDERADWVAWIAAWYVRFGDQAVTARTLAETALSTDPDNLPFADAVPPLLKPLNEAERAKLSNTLGHALRIRVGNVFGELRLNRLESLAHGGAVQWQAAPNEPRVRARVGSVGSNGTIVTIVTTDPDSEFETPGDDTGDDPGVSSPPFGPPASVQNGADGDDGDDGDDVSNAPHARAREADLAGAGQISAFPTPDLEVLTTAAEVASYLPRMLSATAVAVDTETTALSPLEGTVRLVQLAAADGPVLVVDVAAVDVHTLAPLFGADGPRLIGHHLSFDLWHLWRAGLPMPPAGRLFDTELASRLLDASAERFGPQTLAALVERYLRQGLPKEEQTSDWSQRELSLEQVAYAARDASATYALARALQRRIRDEGLQQALAIEMGALLGMVWLADSGVAVDAALWDAPARRALVETKRLRQELTRLAGTGGMPGDMGDYRFSTLNWNSADQVLRLLNRRGHYPVDNLGRPSTAEEAIMALQSDDPVVSLLLDYREAAKRDGVYGLDYLQQHLSADGRIHADFHQLGAATGRMSCRGPNLQQIPRRGGYREAFRPPPGRVLVKADFSQVQLAIAADVSNDQTMRDAFLQGADVHALTASKVLGVELEQVSKDQRQAAKAVNFGFIFGMRPETFRRHARADYGVSIDSQTATRMRAAYFETYAGIAAWHNRRENRDQWDAERQMFVPHAIEVRVPSGRRRLHVARATEKLNSPIQMIEADGLKCGLARLWATRERVPSARLVLVVHDEVVAEVDECDASAAAAWLRGELEAGMQQWLTRVPVSVETQVAADWAGTPLEVHL